MISAAEPLFARFRTNCAESVKRIILIAMSEPTRSETQLGLADLKKRLNAAGLQIIEQQRASGLQQTTYFAIGISERQTDITIPDTFLDDLPGTKEYHTKVDSYAHAVAGRLKCGSPEVFYCRSRVAVRVSIRWPIQAAIVNSVFSTFVLLEIINQVNGQIAKCSAELGLSDNRTILDTVVLTVNSVRTAIDGGSVTFYSPDVWQEKYQRIEFQYQTPEPRPQPEVEQFLARKACILGFFAVDEPADVWAADPWDARYLGVTKKELSLAMRILQAKGLLEPGSTSPEYVRPTNKLLKSSQPRRKITRLCLTLSKAFRD